MRSGSRKAKNSVMRNWLVGKDLYFNAGSVFVPSARMRVNVIPIVLNVLLPFFGYLILTTLSSFRFRHDH